MIKEKHIVVDGLLCTYTEAGHGEPLLLLHGWGCKSSTFIGIQSKLKEKYKVYVLDFPGFGKTDEPKEVWNCEDYANWTVNFINKINIVSPIVLGHSFGGRIALILNSRIPLKSLILTGCAGLILNDVKSSQRRKVFFKVGKIFHNILPQWVSGKMKEMVIEQLGSEDYKNSSKIMREILKKVISQDLAEYAIKVKIPTILIWGQDDADTPISMGEKFHELIPKSEFKVIANAGHYAFIDNKDEFLMLTQTFLNTNL